MGRAARDAEAKGAGPTFDPPVRGAAAAIAPVERLGAAAVAEARALGGVDFSGSLTGATSTSSAAMSARIVTLLPQRRQSMRSVRPATFSSAIWYFALQFGQRNFISLGSLVVGWLHRTRAEKKAPVGAWIELRSSCLEQAHQMFFDAAACFFVRGTSERALPAFHRFVFEAGALVENGEVFERGKVARGEYQCGLQCVDRIEDILFAAVQQAKMVVQTKGGGLDGDGELEIDDGLVDVAS